MSKGRPIFLLLLVGPAAVAMACGAFSGTDGGGQGDAGQSDAGQSDAGLIETGPPDADAAAACVGEPKWTALADTNGSATCGGAAGVSILTDPNHCGRCDHSCDGDLCVRGRCERRELSVAALSLAATPDVLWAVSAVDGGNGAARAYRSILPDDNASGAPDLTLAVVPDAVLASGPFGTYGIGLDDDDNIFQLTSAGMLRIGADQTVTNEFQPAYNVASGFFGIDRSSGTAYFSRGKNIISFDGVALPEAGTSPVLVRTTEGANEIAAGDGSVFWLQGDWRTSSSARSSVHRVNAADLGARQLALPPDAKPQNLLQHNGYVYWMDASKGIFRLPSTFDGATPIETIIGERGPFAFRSSKDDDCRQLAVDDTHIYWIEAPPADSASAPTDRRGAQILKKRALCGGEEVELAAVSYACDLVVTQDYVAWNKLGTVSTMHK